ncbi:vacuolar membrane-associated protein iml1, partial [Coemansia sp. RSA 2167]
LTLPAGRQLAVPFSTAAAPNQPSAPLAPDYHSGSPQYNKAAWLDRLSAHGPDSGTSRTLRGRSYDPYNPCNPELYPLPQTELSQRWTYAFSTHTLLSSYTPKWRSLCTPASLPLVTDYYPTDLDSFYHHYFYHIKTPDINAEDFVDLPQEDFGEFSQFMTTRAQSSASLATRTDAMRRTDRSTFIMLKEMVYQRLAQGFQFIVMDHSVGSRSRDTSRMVFGSGWPKHNGRSDSEWFGGRSIADYASASSTMAPPGAMQKTDRAIWMSNGRQIQKLEFHDNSGSTHMPGVLVTRWERNNPFDQSDLQYRFQMWSRNNNMGYSAADTRFSYPMDEDVNWNNLDYMITGYQSNLTRAMRYWRTRYVLIPMEQLGNDTIVNTKSSPHMSVEDLRIANFEKFLDHILRLLRKDEKNRLEDRFLGSLPPELRRSTNAFSSNESSRRNALKSNANGSQPGSSQQQFPAPPPQLTHALSMHDTRKAVGLSDLVPSSIMQIRYTTLYPVQYIANQLSSYMSDAIYLDPSTAIPLPPPAATVLGLVDSINAESPFGQLAHTLQHPQAGISLRNTRWHFGYFKNIFVGYQLVDWVLVNFDSVTRRSQAVAAGNRLMERGVFRSPHRPGMFLDGFYFYEFTEAALRCKSQSQATSKSQNSLMTSIGFADMVSRYGPGSNNPSPSASRPVSRQGSAAPSLVNDAEPVAVSTANTPNISTVLTGNTPKPTMLDGRDARKQGPRTSSLRETPNDLSVDTRMGGSSAQPLSRLRECLDVPASSSPTAPGTMPFSMRVDESGGSSSINSGRRGADADRQRTTGSQHVANSNGNSVNVDGQTESSPQSAAFEFERTPDIFPEQLRANSRRPLPKSLHQSRVFALNLDQQRKSTRIEQCVVHLDAVHNPTTCFHLSVNWLNCTSHLVDELVRGWARMAERCGMRLVEAPRAQDTSAEDNHPFHSPIRITLAAPPPPATHIFDADWEDEFALFGDDVEEPGDDVKLNDFDSAEPGSNGAEPNGLDSAVPGSDLAEQRRARVRMRMARCIPTFPFERELLEEQDFVLDVEAESSYPSSSLMAREYTYDRAGHQYTQYVHRSGTAFVQICGPGQFLWLNNYLYTSHQSHVRPPPQSQTTATSLAAGASQMSLGTYNARNDGSSVTLAAGPSSEVSSGSTPATRPLGRLVHSSSGGGRAAVSTGHDSESYVVPNRAAPVYYPMRQSREMWPHQVLHSLARNRSPSRQLNVPDTYSTQIVDDLGKLPADFDSVNAAVTRVAVMRDAATPSGRSGRSKHVVNETRGEWAGSTSGLAGVSPADAGPDALRANFIEICTDENSLKMFWQQTIQRYRSGWRDIKSMQSVAGEPQRSRPMVVDKFSEAMWQPRRHLPPTT